MDCLFCKIIKGEIPCAKVYEDEDILAFLDILPVNAGHTLVIPKKHYENLADATEEVLSKLILAVKKIGQAVLAADNYHGFNIGLNNGSAAGQLVPHLHFHIMPRMENDGYQLWHGKKYEEGEMEKWAEKIREAIERSS